MRSDFIKRLKVLLGEQQLFTDPADCRAYGYDNSTLQGQPLAVALPESHQQVASIVAACRTHGVSLITRGQATGTTGATVPVDEHTLMLSMLRMNSIIEINRDNRLMVVQPGVTNQVVQDAAAEQGFFWPP
ncbi:MAG: FAD-binding oxidoreductase, partial [Thiogranum sp.]